MLNLNDNDDEISKFFSNNNFTTLQSSNNYWDILLEYLSHKIKKFLGDNLIELSLPVDERSSQIFSDLFIIQQCLLFIYYYLYYFKEKYKRNNNLSYTNLFYNSEDLISLVMKENFSIKVTLNDGKSMFIVFSFSIC
jgi:hypothetical protein